MSDAPLMPIATSVWLIDNTALSFEQIANFCKLHPLQVRGIADGDVGAGVRGINPITNGQLAREEIETGQSDPDYRLKLSLPKTIVAQKTKKGPRYTPVSKRQNRPDAIAWLVKNHPELKDSQISKLLGTTKTTITAVRKRTHWNSANLVPQDPVGFGLCSQIDLDGAVQKAAARLAKLAPPPTPEGPALKPVEETLAPEAPATATETAQEESSKVDLGNVFANFPDPEETSE